jgi:hypothetical protein
MVHDSSFFGSTADFVIKKEHFLGFLPDLAISKRQRRRVEITKGKMYMHVKKEDLCCKFLIFNNCNFVCFRVFLLYTSTESTCICIMELHQFTSGTPYIPQKNKTKLTNLIIVP